MLGPQWYMLCVSHGVCLLVTMHFALCSFLSSSGHRCLSSWPVWTRRTFSWREGAVRGAVQKTADFPQFQFIMVVVIPVVTQRQIPMVLVTKRFTCFWTIVIDVPVVQDVLLPGFSPDVQKTVAIPTGAVLGQGDMPVVERQVSLSGQCRKLRSSHECISWTFSSRQC